MHLDRFGVAAPASGWALVACLCAGHVLADDVLLEKIPRSTITDSYSATEVEPYDFVYAPVEKVKREITFERVARVEGLVRHVTYQMSSDVNRDDALDWYRDQIQSIGGRVVFECDGRDCGRATIWANEIFKQRVLATVDSKQHYLAGELGGEDNHELFAVYIVERGNQTVYSHVVRASVEGNLQLGDNQDFSGALARHGFVVVDGVVPNRYGVLSSEAIDRLTSLSSQLDDFKNEIIYVLCHVNGSRPVDQLIQESESCAEAAVAALKGESEYDVRPFGVGPLAPLADATPKSRVEVVIPKLLRREP
ncbi:MAG: DUF4892 domain-containing protein [Gammaproteobacteria bacterium]|nr:DUF4892 domain-containing protein [Gammaproteobacteria bacterium]